MILTAGFRSVFVSPLRNMRVSALVSGLNQMPHKLAATFWDVCCLKCPNWFGYSDSYHFYKSLGLESLGGGGVHGTLGLQLSITFSKIQPDIHTYIHTYMHTYIHAYIHTYMHTYIHTSGWIFQKIIDSYKHSVVSTPSPKPCSLKLLLNS